MIDLGIIALQVTLVNHNLVECYGSPYLSSMVLRGMILVVVERYMLLLMALWTCLELKFASYILLILVPYCGNFTSMQMSLDTTYILVLFFWKIVPLALMWTLWLERHERIFDGAELSLSSLRTDLQVFSFSFFTQGNMGNTHDRISFDIFFYLYKGWPCIESKFVSPTSGTRSGWTWNVGLLLLDTFGS